MASVTYEAQSGALEGASLTAAVLTGPSTTNGSVVPFAGQYDEDKDLTTTPPTLLYRSIIDDRTPGNRSLDGSGTDETTNFYLGATIPTPVDGLSLGAAYDHVDNAAGNGIDVDVFALYASYQATDKLSLHGRIEYLDGDNGIFGDKYTDHETIFSPVYESGIDGFETFDAASVDANGNAVLNDRVGVDATGMSQNVAANQPAPDGWAQTTKASARRDNDVEILSLTATVQYDLWENVLTRVEARYDQQVDDNADNFSGDDDVFTLTLNAVYSF